MIANLTQYNILNLSDMTPYEQVQYANTQPYAITAIIVLLSLYILLGFIIGMTKITGREHSKICFQSNVYWKTFLIPLIFAIILYLVLFIAPITFNIIR